MTLFVGLIILAGCSKKNSDPTDVSNNYLATQFKLGESLLGLDRANVDQMMANNGWTYSRLYEGVEYVKGSAHANVVFTNSSSGNADEVTFEFLDNARSDLQNKDKYLEFINYLGKSYKMTNGSVYNFKYCHYLVGTGKDDYEKIDDFDELVKNFNAVYNSKEWNIFWEESIFLSIDEDKGENKRIILCISDNKPIL